MSRLRKTLAAVAVAVGLPMAAAVAWLAWPDAPIAIEPTAAPASTPAGVTPSQTATVVERGRQLATLGNCQHCHTARGQAPYSGGRGIPTPFGTVYSSNLTPSAKGLGGWTATDFWRALHHGQSRSGRWLYPAFPYPNTTHVTRADSDALWAYLQSLPPSDRVTPPHALDWPYRTQAALKVWRTLFFRPAAETGESAPDASVSQRTAEVQRGAYLARGLAHCSACHAPRNALGAAPRPLDLSGGTIPGQDWYAPSLHDPVQGGVQHWPEADVQALLQTGRTPDAATPAFVTGPMAEVVQHSTQHWPQADRSALAAYLRQLPLAPASVPATAPVQPAGPPTTPSASTATLTPLGARLYLDRCAECHGTQGEGRRLGPSDRGPWAYPPLAGNRAVTQDPPVNLVHMVMNGGYGPATAGHPRPFGMPPFVLQLSDAELAAVLTHIRTQWGHRATPVTEQQVQALRGSPSR